MSDDSEWHGDGDDRGEREDARRPADGGIALDTFWARLDPIDT